MNMDVPTPEQSIKNKLLINDIEIRAAKHSEQGNVAELMYSSGADMYDYVYTTPTKHALDYIRYELPTVRGMCSHKLLTVAEHNGKVVATGTFYDRQQYKQMSNSATVNLLRFYGIRVLPRILRALDSMKLMRPPKPDELYLANFGVAPELRGMGIGSKLLKHKIAQAQQQGYRIVSLDVSTKNPKAEALYDRLGFAVTKSKAITGRDGKEYACKKMELFL